MSDCYDRYRHEREGESAGRWGANYGYDHTQKMRNAEYDRYGCDAAYADGYEREVRRQEEQRQEERQAEERQEQARAEEREWQERCAQEEYEQQQHQNAMEQAAEEQNQENPDGR